MVDRIFCYPDPEPDRGGQNDADPTGSGSKSLKLSVGKFGGKLSLILYMAKLCPFLTLHDQNQTIDPEHIHPGTD